MRKIHSHPQSIRSAQPFELWIAKLPAGNSRFLKCGRRPVAVVSENSYEDTSLVSVVPLTRNLTATQLPSHVLLCNRFLDAPSRALCEQVTTVDRSRLIRRIGFVEDAFDRFALRRALSTHLNLTPLQESIFQDNSIYLPMDSL